MKVAFVSNFFNHHQSPFCEKMATLLGEDFKFIATTSVPEERKKMGYLDIAPSYHIDASASDENKLAAMEYCEQADAVILGDAPIEYIEKRLQENKLTFKYTERYFRNGKWHILDPRVFFSIYKNDIKYKYKNLYLLCAGAYVKTDMKLIGCYKNKAYKWGYFPEVIKYDAENLQSKKISGEILFVGRFLALKHPDLVVKVAHFLDKNGYDFHLTMIGEGPCEKKVNKLINKYNLQQKIALKPFMSQQAVREHMENAEIFLFTSDKQEGWGAVLNESMNSCCAVVANKVIGSVPYLIKDGENGFCYKSKKELYKKVKFLLDNRLERKKIGINAYKTMAEEWNANVAAERFVELVKSLKKGEDSQYKSGPCSKD